MAGVVKISNLVRPASMMAAPCFRLERGHDTERNYYPSYLRLLAAAKSLALDEQFLDSRLLLLLSMECFLKYLYCVVREVMLPPQIWEHPEIGALGAWRFRHDIYKLAKHLQAATDLETREDYKYFMSVLLEDKGEAWIEQRYSAARHDQFSAKYQKQLAAFENILNGTLREFR